MAGGVILTELGAFCSRVARFGPGTLVRLTGGDAWARLPIDVLVTRKIETTPGVYQAGELLASLDGTPLPPSRDHDWRGALPGGPGRVLESIPAAELRGIAEAAASTMRSANPAIGERRVRDALLEHVAISVTAADGEAAEVPLRLVLGLARMGFAGEGAVLVLRSGPWTGLRGEHGTAWYRPSLPLLTR
ncbi:hypothetical protein [Longispora albida]|uniref:hypothetical protein n=1 Tax=Longispora albida TaxID=203523 RepID=UPI00035ED54F|nr:hypothetical protein [Longispora albida]